ncbi:alpha/beta fold hydrolase [Shewanella marina]|uniref:alpha/beta fold hydrolase n=1 Tax=Shewanella marina TaxID=487319 RepID=UPI0004729939|nr:alpha/beta hydrolase [Shewanella marina]
MDIEQHSLFIKSGIDELHLRLIKPVTALYAEPILMLHGSMSNGRVFYSDSGKGLACFLAQAGFCVYVLDSAGRGLSKPALADGHNPSQTDVIKFHLPLVQQFIQHRHPQQKMHWCGHSWGGVMLLSAILRQPAITTDIASIVTFATKRRIYTRSLKKWFMVDVVWNKVAPRLAKKHNYFAAKHYKLGMDNESLACLLQSIDWVSGDWVDSEDGFDYLRQSERVNWPIARFYAAQNDPVLGHQNDVKRTMLECGLADAEFILLAKQHGYKHDYDHAGILTHADAATDHFIELLSWYQAHSSLLTSETVVTLHD